MIVIDTQIWIWAVQGVDRLSRRQIEAIRGEPESIMLSAISLWETAMAIDRGSMVTTSSALQWIDQALGFQGLKVVELTPPIVCQAMDLPKGFHKDPADRLIAATALVLDCPLLTSDH